MICHNVICARSAQMVVHFPLCGIFSSANWVGELYIQERKTTNFGLPFDLINEYIERGEGRRRPQFCLNGRIFTSFSSIFDSFVPNTISPCSWPKEELWSGSRKSRKVYCLTCKYWTLQKSEILNMFLIMVSCQKLRQGRSSPERKVWKCDALKQASKNTQQYMFVSK